MQWRFSHSIIPTCSGDSLDSEQSLYLHFFGTSTEKITTNPMDYAPYLDDMHS